MAGYYFLLPAPSLWTPPKADGEGDKAVISQM